MSRVYLAREALPDRDVAIKVLDEGLSGKLGAERFVREVHVTSRLSHPYIVPIYAAGDADGMLYYVMPFISGKSLRDLLEEHGRLPVDDALRVTLQVAGALAHAHGEGIVHRDIKPANILFQSGHAVVTDFGISRAVHVAEGGDITQTGLSLGTPAYMSPEQALSDGPIDARTDVYALGCVLYEMLAGHVPFRGRTPQATLAKHMAEDVPSLQARRGDVSAELESAVHKALAKAPEDRFGSARELADALRRADTRATVTVLTPERVQRPRRRLSGRPAQVVGTILAVAATGLAYQAWTSGPTPVRANSLYRDSVAIMPFLNRTGDPALEYVGASLADEISSHLAEVPEVKVIASYSVASLWGTNLGMRDLLDTLDIGHLFDGSLELRDGELTINVQHFNADGVLVDSHSFAAPEGLLDSLQSAVAHSIAESFLASAGVPRIFEEADSYGPGRDAYLNGTAWLGQRTREGLRTAIERFTEAIELDRSYAAAYAGLSNSYALSLVYNYDVGVSPYQAAARAVYFADRAVDLDPTDAATYTARGYIRALVQQDVDVAQEAFRRALAIAPNAPDGPSWSARILEARGQIDDAFREAVRARDLDPFHSARHIAVAGLAMVQREYALAIEEAREALRLEPTLLLARAFEARSLALAGRADECLQLDLGVYGLIRALCLAAVGREGEADELVAEAEAELADGAVFDEEYSPALSYQDLAVFHAFTGDAEGAARWLRAAFDESPFGVDPRLLDSALFDPVRVDSSFAAALAEVRAEAWPRIQRELERL